MMGWRLSMPCLSIHLRRLVLRLAEAERARADEDRTRGTDSRRYWDDVHFGS